MTQNEALKLALEALEEYVNVVVSVNDPNKWTPKVSDAGGPARKAITAIKEALAQPEQEPIGYLSEGGAERLLTKKQAHEHIKNFRLFTHDVPVYTTPPQRTWVGLTDEEIDELFEDGLGFEKPRAIYREIEAKLKEKNNV